MAFAIFCAAARTPGQHSRTERDQEEALVPESERQKNPTLRSKHFRPSSRTFNTTFGWLIRNQEKYSARKPWKTKLELQAERTDAQ